MEKETGFLEAFNEDVEHVDVSEELLAGEFPWTSV